LDCHKGYEVLYIEGYKKWKRQWQV
jgi:hypothetical protein